MSISGSDEPLVYELYVIFIWPQKNVAFLLYYNYVMVLSLSICRHNGFHVFNI
jgi:hypothetical protein